MSNHRKHLLHIRGKEKFVAFIKAKGWTISHTYDDGHEHYENPLILKILVIAPARGDYHQLTGVGAVLVAEYNELAAIHNATPRGALSEISQEART